MYALNLTDENRISVIFPPVCSEFAPDDYLRVKVVPDEVLENASDYRYIEGKFVLDPLPEVEDAATGTEMDDVYAALAELAAMIGG